MNTAATPAASPIHNRCMQFAERLDAEWLRLVQAMASFRRVMDGTEIMDVLGLRTLYYATPNDYIHQSRVFDRVTQYAAKALSPTQTPLSLDWGDLRERFVSDRYADDQRGSAKLEEFSAIAVMAAVLALAEPQAETNGLRQLTDRFYNTFRRDAPRSVGGRVVFTLGAYTYDRKFGDTNEYEYNTRNEIQQTLGLFEEVLPRLGQEGFGEVVARNMVTSCVHQLEWAHWKANRTLRIPFGPIELRLFQRKVEFHVPAKLAEAINLFVGTHRTQDKAAA